ncbi:hypothetical protein F4809DRAFT_611594 [Biscogniauxia mediterranea]|nr:hypothetical protein F4809DRAFT_611594 [Biscogniauxia mediterranea]
MEIDRQTDNIEVVFFFSSASFSFPLTYPTQLRVVIQLISPPGHCGYSLVSTWVDSPQLLCYSSTIGRFGLRAGGGSVRFQLEGRRRERNFGLIHKHLKPNVLFYLLPSLPPSLASFSPPFFLVSATCIFINLHIGRRNSNWT